MTTKKNKGGDYKWEIKKEGQLNIAVVKDGHRYLMKKQVLCVNQRFLSLLFRSIII